MMNVPGETMASRDGRGDSALAAWLKTIHARLAYQAALARGDSYAYAET